MGDMTIEEIEGIVSECEQRDKDGYYPCACSLRKLPPVVRQLLAQLAEANDRADRHEADARRMEWIGSDKFHKLTRIKASDGFHYDCQGDSGWLYDEDTAREAIDAAEKEGE